MKKYLITVQYLGTKYCGFQKQDNGLAIQEVIETALKKVLNQNIEIFASGRTDAGVHALAQTAHFEAETTIPANKIPFAVNKYLPEDIKIIACKEVSKNFHARFDVKKKTYQYNCYVSNIALPIFEQTNYQLVKKPDINEMNKLAKQLEGTHNFKAFMSAGGQAKTFERTIYAIKIKQSKNQIIFEVTGNGFLYNMVRIIVGSLLEVGYGKKQVSDIVLAMQNEDRTKTGYLVPAKGLFLKSVKY